MTNYQNKLKISTIVVCLFCLFLCGFKFVSYDNLTVTFVNVGQGDAALLEYKSVKVLIDAGPDNSVNAYFDGFTYFPFCSLDYIFLTHPHADHYFGFKRLLQRCNFTKFYFNHYFVAESVKSVLSDYPFYSALAGQSITLADLKLYILWPDINHMDLISENINNQSLVILLDYKDFEVLFTGDAEANVLTIVTQNNVVLFDNVIDNRLDILKVPHHGAVNALSPLLYERLRPLNCIISVGAENKYHHPHAEVLKYLKDVNCKVLRTDTDGNIVFKVQ